GIHDKDVVEEPYVVHVIVAGEHEVDLQLGEEGEDVARIPDRVALATCPGHRYQMVVQDEDAEVGRIVELLADPRVALAPNLALGQVRLGGVDGDDLHGHVPEGESEDPVALLGHVAGSERVAEVEIADVLGVVVPGYDQGLELGLEERLEVALGGAEL